LEGVACIVLTSAWRNIRPFIQAVYGFFFGWRSV